MKAHLQHTTPLLISAGEAQLVERVPLEAKDFEEKWLQRLILAHPELLPVREIEPVLTPAVPVCLELPVASGSVDNFYVTPDGGLILAECKLWRNPEARREVVVQAIDYASCLQGWTYPELEAAVSKGTQLDGSKVESLWSLVKEQSELEEAEFVDAVARNLRLGRCLVLIVGDGIREGVESLVDYLQAHAGLHFTLALVELALFKLPGDGGTLVQPRVIGRTVNIERAVVGIKDGKVAIGSPKPATAGKSTTLTEEEYFEALATLNPEWPERIQKFLEQVVPLGVEPEYKKSLILRWYAPDGTSINLAYITKDGKVWTDCVNWKTKDLGALAESHQYVEDLAAAIAGTVNKDSDQGHWWVMVGKSAPVIGVLLDHADAWVAAIERITSVIATKVGG